TRVSSQQKLSLSLEVGQRFSLLPLTPKVRGIYLSGAKWNLTDAELKLGESRGLSNVVVGGEIQLAVGEGVLLLTLG
ncbi:MAG: hypothetical protein ACKO96_17415, partial [Flammeovirgaceae bacterium]